MTRPVSSLSPTWEWKYFTNLDPTVQDKWKWTISENMSWTWIQTGWNLNLTRRIGRGIGKWSTVCRGMKNPKKEKRRSNYKKERKKNPFQARSKCLSHVEENHKYRKNIATTGKGQGSGKTLGISSLKTEQSDWEVENRLRQSSAAPYWNCYLHTTQHGNLLLDPTDIGLINLRTKASAARDSSSLSWAFVLCWCFVKRHFFCSCKWDFIQPKETRATHHGNHSTRCFTYFQQ